MGIEIIMLGGKFDIPYIDFALEDVGYDVITALDFNTGADRLKEKKSPVVILYYRLPPGQIRLPSDVDPDDYVALTRHYIDQIRQIPNYGETPIIVGHNFNEAVDLRALQSMGGVKLFHLYKDGSSSAFAETVVHSIPEFE